MVDDENIDGAGSGDELEAELFLQGLQKHGSCRVGLPLLAKQSL